MAENPVGVDYPIRLGRGGYFDQTFTSIEQVKANIINVLNTAKGERFGRPNFGTRLYDILYESNTDGIENRIRAEVENTLDEWLPYVTVEQMLVQVENGTAKIALEFSTEFTADETENVMIWAEFDENNG